MACRSRSGVINDRGAVLLVRGTLDLAFVGRDTVQDLFVGKINLGGYILEVVV